MPALPDIRNPQTHIEPRVHRALEEQRKKDREGRARGLYFSELGQCERKLWALLNGYPDEEIPGKRLAIFEMGNHVERMVIEMLRSAGYRVTRQQERAAFDFGEGRTASGRVDGVIELPGRTKADAYDAVLEVKSANLEQFELCVKQGYAVWRPAYADTLHVYMDALGIPVALAVVVCKNDSRWYCEKVRLDPKRSDALKAKAERILTSRKAPDRPGEANGQYSAYCKWCHLSEACYGPIFEKVFDA